MSTDTKVQLHFKIMDSETFAGLDKSHFSSLFSDSNMLARISDYTTPYMMDENTQFFGWFAPEDYDVIELRGKLVALVCFYRLDVEKQMSFPLKSMMPVSQCLWMDFFAVHSTLRNKGIAKNFILPLIKTQLPCFAVVKKDNLACLNVLQHDFITCGEFENAKKIVYLLLHGKK